jgi:hypothetical protein
LYDPDPGVKKTLRSTSTSRLTGKRKKKEVEEKEEKEGVEGMRVAVGTMTEFSLRVTIKTNPTAISTPLQAPTPAPTPVPKLVPTPAAILMIPI